MKYLLRMRNYPRTRYNNSNYFMNANNLVDLGFSSNPFTWHNKRDDGVVIFSRLDRAMANRQWIQIYPSFIVNHLSIIEYNNALIVLDTRSRNFKKLIDFDAKWLFKDNFMDIVKSVWSTVIKSSLAFQPVRKTNLFKRESLQPN